MILFASRTSIKETCADMDRETVVSRLFGSVKGEDRSRPGRCANIERKVKISATSLNGKLNWPCDGINWTAQRHKLYR